jgi:hypothetical protein
MSALPPVDPELNRRVIAERLDWPAGAADACEAIERDYPRWSAFWVAGDLPPWSARRGYRAVAQRHWVDVHAFGETPEKLRAEIAEADPKLPER